MFGVVLELELELEFDACVYVCNRCSILQTETETKRVSKLFQMKEAHNKCDEI